jgi:hypothetical protein
VELQRCNPWPGSVKYPPIAERAVLSLGTIDPVSQRMSRKPDRSIISRLPRRDAGGPRQANKIAPVINWAFHVGRN